MTTISISQDRERAMKRACDVLSAGNLVALPTETVYGLAGDATNGTAVARIFEVKGRPSFNPLICHVSTREMAEAHVVFGPIARRLADAFWPGPLTIVLPVRADSTVHPLALAGLDTLAVRVPTGFANDLIARFGRPLAAPSANSSGSVSPTRAAHVEADLGGRIPLILDGGPAAVGLESTIVKVEDHTITLLRPGGLPLDAIEAVAGVEVRRRGASEPAIEAPGMMRSHYAPKRPLRTDARSVQPGEALITFAGQEPQGKDGASFVLDLSPAGNLREAAANLFDYMKRADASGASAIAVVPIPHTGLGEAINDRLSRASAPRDTDRWHSGSAPDINAS
jgi:L-threonylcarbamoyladenylate synthase